MILNFESMAIEVIDNIYDEKEHCNGIKCEEIYNEMNYFTDSYGFDYLLKEINKLCKERNIHIIY